MDYVHRSEREAKLARAIARMTSAQQRKLFEIMGNPPKIENVGYEYWNGHLAAWQGVLTPELESIFVDSAIEMLAANTAIGVSWDLVNQDAADWARQYGGKLAGDVDARTLQGVRDAIADFYDQGENLGQLRERLGRWYGPARATTIATTEVTRAAVEGERAVVAELAKEGIEMVPIHQTNNDELVCPRCGPRHGKQITDGIFPPLHTRCRCWVTHEFAQPVIQ